jgi:hypothetical protein
MSPSSSDDRRTWPGSSRKSGTGNDQTTIRRANHRVRAKSAPQNQINRTVVGLQREEYGCNEQRVPEWKATRCVSAEGLESSVNVT